MSYFTSEEVDNTEEIGTYTKKEKDIEHKKKLEARCCYCKKHNIQPEEARTMCDGCEHGVTRECVHGPDDVCHCDCATICTMTIEELRKLEEID